MISVTMEGGVIGGGDAEEEDERGDERDDKEGVDDAITPRPTERHHLGQQTREPLPQLSPSIGRDRHRS